MYIIKIGDEDMILLEYSNIGNILFEKLLGYNKNLLKYWNNLFDFLSSDGVISKELKEELRRLLV